ncbi:SMP-30/gluconolactonase/LRE family protein [Lactiplantibacillus plantarum]|uniref:SMP-30/gluconolactonase/LRE family protein n=1 Tax=Lactiplantibacillus plantarum TaxID=1590 RepID=UPI00093313C4|nr:SMP-30/gluconolactonase/LRE family protein [Lactiplantibacillus plantarum]MDV9115109.1 SMP-30/gluconolactonase/LRE family protein [Lactiplantibacillus plantarum]
MNNKVQNKYFPIPENERHLDTVTATEFVVIPSEITGMNFLEGLCFRDADNLLVCNTFQSKIYSVNVQTKAVNLFTILPGHAFPTGICVHQNGNIFVACSGSDDGSMIIVLSNQGQLLKKLLVGTTRSIDDLVFDRKGGFFFTDLAGTHNRRTAGVFYMAPDLITVHSVVATGMVASNGIALSPDEKVLWVTDFGGAKLYRFNLADDGYHIQPYNSLTPYTFTGTDGPDSATIDEDGNLYVAMCGQARYLIFNPNGFPIGQVLIPEREQGKMAKSTHMAIRPFTNSGFFCASDPNTGECKIYQADVYSNANLGYQFT